MTTPEAISVEFQIKFRVSWHDNGHHHPNYRQGAAAAITTKTTEERFGTTSGLPTCSGAST